MTTNDKETKETIEEKIARIKAEKGSKGKGSKGKGSLDPAPAPQPTSIEDVNVPFNKEEGLADKAKMALLEAQEKSDAANQVLKDLQTIASQPAFQPILGRCTCDGYNFNVKLMKPQVLGMRVTDGKSEFAITNISQPNPTAPPKLTCVKVVGMDTVVQGVSEEDVIIEFFGWVAQQNKMLITNSLPPQKFAEIRKAFLSRIKVD